MPNEDDTKGPMLGKEKYTTYVQSVGYGSLAV